MTSNIGNYSLTNSIDYGNYIKYKATNINTGEIFNAISIIPETTLKTDFFYSFRNIFEILGSINHNNIQKFVEYIFVDPQVYFILETNEYSVYDFLNENKPNPCTELMAGEIFLSLIEAVDYLHSLNIVHFDIRLENLLFINQEIKLGNFYFSKIIGECENISSLYGCPNFQAPEIFNSTNYDAKKAEVWSCGIFLYILLTGKLPFYNKNENLSIEEKYDELKFQVLHSSPIIESYFSTDIIDLLHGMLSMNPIRRLSMKEVSNHAFVERIRLKYYKSTKSNSIIFQILRSRRLSENSNNLIKEDLKKNPKKAISFLLKSKKNFQEIINLINNFFSKFKIVQTRKDLFRIFISNPSNLILTLTVEDLNDKILKTLINIKVLRADDDLYLQQTITSFELFLEENY